MARGIRRDVTEKEVGDWLGAAEQRERKIRPRTADAIRLELRRRNYVRYWRLQRDFKWMQKEMKRMGLNPEDARNLL